MATDQDFLKYAQSLPEIYREIFATFPRMEPTRRIGYGLAFQSIAADFADRGLPYKLGEIILAGERLQQQGLAEIQHRIFLKPTELGERVITALTGHQAPQLTVPDLPSPPA